MRWKSKWDSLWISFSLSPCPYSVDIWITSALKLRPKLNFLWSLKIWIVAPNVELVTQCRLPALQFYVKGIASIFHPTYLPLVGTHNSSGIFKIKLQSLAHWLRSYAISWLYSREKKSSEVNINMRKIYHYFSFSNLMYGRKESLEVHLAPSEHSVIFSPSF